MKTIEAVGRFLDDAEITRERLGVSEVTLWRLTQKGMPKPIRIGRYRYFDRQGIDDWLVAQIRTTNSTV